MLRLWRRMAAAALIPLLAWEPPHAAGEALKRRKRVGGGRKGGRKEGRKASKEIWKKQILQRTREKKNKPVIGKLKKKKKKGRGNAYSPLAFVFFKRKKAVCTSMFVSAAIIPEHF